MNGPTFTTVLVANRGEVVARVARSVRRLGLRTAAVYSEPDRRSPVLDSVDVAIALTGSSSTETYLDAKQILAAASAAGADAIHPGYGFLAENATFAQQVIDAGLVWIGPTPETIRAMGDKVAAKRAAAEAGVPVLPGAVLVPDGDVAADVELPVLIKAAGGGGGKGMHLVTDRAYLADTAARAGREAAASFGDPTVFWERYVPRARHVEVQVLGDQHGRVVHLGERECSIQRRHQKVIEEAPSPGVADDTRRALCDAGLRLAARLGYVGPGTVEFVVGPDGFWFLEMNTRLQVEHPVTEEVWGLDLVEWQLRVARGEPLRDDLTTAGPRGHAIEVRVYAEDPATGWTPSVGEISRFRHGGVTDIRHEDGIASGSAVSHHYDPMLAKVIVHRSDRAAAAAALAAELAATQVHGVATNIGFLASTLRHPAFLAGDTTVAFMDEHPELAAAGADPASRPAHLAAVVWAGQAANRHTDQLWGFAPSGWRNVPSQWLTVALTEAEAPVTVRYRVDGASIALSVDNDEPWPARVREMDGPSRVAVEIDGVRRTVSVHRVGDSTWTNTSDGQRRFDHPPRFRDIDAQVAGGGPTAPVPGTVLAVEVGVGQTVSAGQVVVIIEAMKMEHRVTVTADATVTEVLVSVGDQVDAGQVLVRLDG